MVAPYVIAFLVGAIVPFVLWLDYRLAGRTPADLRVVVALAVVGVGALLTVLLTHRTLNEAQLGPILRPALADLEEGFAASRWLTLFLLGAAIVEIVRGWLRARTEIRPEPAKPVLVALLLFYVGTVLIQSVASQEPGFSYKEAYVPLLLAAIYYQRVPDLARVASGAKWVVLLLGAGSLLAAIVRPDFVLHRPEAGLIPGIDWRLYGLTPHANTIGPIALLAILLELQWPSRLTLVRTLHLGTALTVLILAQSKTVWVAAVAILVLVHVPLAIRPRSPAAASRADFRRAVWTIVACIVAVVVLASLSLFADSLEPASTREVDLSSLSGRLPIWDITLSAWRENVLFGYGPEIWGVRRRAQFNLFHVGQAHNQVVQTLGEAGAFGLALLVLYLGTLLVVALRRFTASRGIVLALLLLVLARCVTEAPMRSEGILSWATFMQVLLVTFACHFARTRDCGSLPVTMSERGSRAATVEFLDTQPADGLAAGRPRRASASA